MRVQDVVEQSMDGVLLATFCIFMKIVSFALKAQTYRDLLLTILRAIFSYQLYVNGSLRGPRGL